MILQCELVLFRLDLGAATNSTISCVSLLSQPWPGCLLSLALGPSNRLSAIPWALPQPASPLATLCITCPDGVGVTTVFFSQSSDLHLRTFQHARLFPVFRPKSDLQVHRLRSGSVFYFIYGIKYAHDVKYADMFSNAPLAAAVCERNPLNMEGVQQANIYNSINDYLSPTMGTPSGWLLCMLSIFLWMLTCGKEAAKGLEALLCVWTSAVDVYKKSGQWLSTSSLEMITPIVTTVKGDAVKRELAVIISRSRAMVLMVCVFLPRAWVLLYLGFVGAKFLANTIALQELILNSVALEVVLNVDELMYCVLAPSSVKHIIHNIMPLRVPKFEAKRGRIARYISYCRVVVICIVLVLISQVIVAPIESNIREAERAMCGGQIDFFAGELHSGPVVVAVPDYNAIKREAYVYRAILQRTDLKPSANSKRFYYEGAPFEAATARDFKKIADLTLTEEASHRSSNHGFYARCKDDYRSKQFLSRHATWEAIGDKVGNASVSTCADIIPFCDFPNSTGGLVRLHCPQTCGAHLPKSGLRKRLPQDGVPASCQTALSKALREEPCKDLTKDEIRTTYATSWARFTEALLLDLEGWSQITGTNLTFTQLFQKQGMKAMNKKGCNFFKNKWPPMKGVIKLDFCSVRVNGIDQGGSARLLCPVACGCKAAISNEYKEAGRTWDPQLAWESQCPHSCLNLLDSN